MSERTTSKGHSFTLNIGGALNEHEYLAIMKTARECGQLPSDMCAEIVMRYIAMYREARAADQGR